MQGAQPFPQVHNVPLVASIGKPPARDSGNPRQLVASKNWGIMQKQGRIMPSSTADITAWGSLSEARKHSHEAAQQTQYAAFADHLQVTKVEGASTRAQFYPLQANSSPPTTTLRAVAEAKQSPTAGAPSPRLHWSAEAIPAAQTSASRAEH